MVLLRFPSSGNLVCHSCKLIGQQGNGSDSKPHISTCDLRPAIVCLQQKLTEGLVTFPSVAQSSERAKIIVFNFIS